MASDSNILRLLLFLSSILGQLSLELIDSSELLVCCQTIGPLLLPFSFFVPRLRFSLCVDPGSSFLCLKILVLKYFLVKLTNTLRNFLNFYFFRQFDQSSLISYYLSLSLKNLLVHYSSVINSSHFHYIQIEFYLKLIIKIMIEFKVKQLQESIQCLNQKVNYQIVLNK